jgi:hypothetical protein
MQTTVPARTWLNGQIPGLAQSPSRTTSPRAFFFTETTLSQLRLGCKKVLGLKQSEVGLGIEEENGAGLDVVAGRAQWYS